MNIHESAEDYLEAILMISEVRERVRSVDVAKQLNVTKPSVSFAMKRLRENGYIRMDEDNGINLTDRGMEIAARIYERHKILSSLLIRLGVTPEVAREDACRIEHDISEETFDAVKRAFASLAQQ